MFRVESFLTSIVLLQVGLCSIRDPRDTGKKFEYIEKFLPPMLEEFSTIDPSKNLEKEVMELAGQNYCKTVDLSMKYLNRAIFKNTQDNEEGKFIEKYLETADKFVKDIRLKLLKDNVKYQDNLKKILEAIKNFHDPTIRIVEKAAEWSKNYELALNSILDVVDNAFYYYVATYAQLQKKKADNTELSNEIDRIVSEALLDLKDISPSSYNTNELMEFSLPFKNGVNKLLEELKDLLQNSTNGNIEEAMKKLENLNDDIDLKINSHPSHPKLQELYKKWLIDIVQNIKNLSNLLKENSGKVRIVVLDTLGLAALSKTNFQILNGKIV